MMLKSTLQLVPVALAVGLPPAAPIASMVEIAEPLCRGGVPRKGTVLEKTAVEDASERHCLF